MQTPLRKTFNKSENQYKNLDMKCVCEICNCGGNPIVIQLIINAPKNIIHLKDRQPIITSINPIKSVLINTIQAVRVK